jgi:hypothetical protein
MNKKIINKKGFIFSLEATFALIITMAFITLLTIMIFSIETEKNPNTNLFLLSNDMLYAFDKNDMMIDEEKISYVFDNMLSAYYCARIDVLNENDYIVFSYTKSGCDDYSNKAVNSKRSYVNGENYHIARILMWYRG